MRGVSEGTAAGLGSFVSHLAPRGLVHSVFHSLSLPLPASHSVPSGEARSRRDGMRRILKVTKDPTDPIFFKL